MTAPGPTVPGSWERVLPPRRVAASGVPDGSPTLVDALPLGAATSLAVLGDQAGRRYPVPLVAAPDGTRRARAGDGGAADLVHLLTAGDRTAGRFRLRSWHRGRAGEERPLPVDQTNESVVVGDAVVKWMAIAEEGPHPAPSLLAELSRGGFTRMPRPWGCVEWVPAPADPGRLLALVVEHLDGAADGWTWVVEALRRAAEQDRPQAAAATGTVVGGLVADLHGALAHTARPAAVDEAATWRSGGLADLDRALAVSRGDAARVLRDHEARARSVLAAAPVDGGPVMRVHGDLHVGQVLRADRGGATTHLLTDFDGNPVLPPAERARPQPAAVDVAGVLQSFTHAGLVVLRHTPGLDPGAVDRATACAREAAGAAYRTGLAGHLDLLDERLLLPFAVRQVCREFTYAATHLPRWSYVPEAALPRLLAER